MNREFAHVSKSSETWGTRRRDWISIRSRGAGVRGGEGVSLSPRLENRETWGTRTLKKYSYFSFPK